MKGIPSPDECIGLLRQSGCSEKVLNHCMAVRDYAVRIAVKADADVVLVEAGALLHDIGRCVTHGIFHGVEGGRVAKKLGLPIAIVNIIERHVGAGISKVEAKKMGLPVKDYSPVSLEEKIVCHADSLINDVIQVSLEAQVENARGKGLNEYAERLVFLHRELSNICGMDVNLI